MNHDDGRIADVQEVNGIRIGAQILYRWRSAGGERRHGRVTAFTKNNEAIVYWNGVRNDVRLDDVYYHGQPVHNLEKGK